MDWQASLVPTYVHVRTCQLLRAPVASMSLSLVSYGDSDSDIEPEDTNSAKPGSDVRKLLSVLPSSRGSLKQKGPVKIGLPTLNKGGVSCSHASCLTKYSFVR